MTTTPWQVAPWSPDQAPEIRELFHRVFGHSMPSILWDWKYGSGRGVATIIRDHAGRMVGHYGGMSRQIDFFGQPEIAVQIGDVMVAPEARGILTRRGPVALMTAAFLDSWIGFNRAYLVGFGFPNSRAFRVAERLKLYADVGRVNEIYWPYLANKKFSAWPTSFHPIDWSKNKTVEQLDVAWEKMRNSTVGWIIPQRNGAWWRHRFANHPLYQYKCYWLCERWSRKKWAALALRPGKAAGDSWELMDWIGDYEDSQDILHAARQIAANNGAELKGWFSSTLTNTLITPDSIVTDIQVHIPTSIHRLGPDPEQLRGKWWLTGGDTDFR